ncbi:aminoglycoside 3'-phosphotransferase [Arthrobacter sp. NIO-1057]|uniref:aminoglycoside 3'-phosphotransferase n=1 Tax=Arthrobacter sp. NIO-1057 TaxID=993071 RepID=UPI000817800B|nr:aminoglycoside 3'-phosphotransferase [Arthrobacter sp. NIO-1057]SCC39135.1 kanamycin kinase [Arthrobacter sp. NIO-1057]
MSSPQVISGPTPEDHPIPIRVREAAEGSKIEGIWLNALGGLTYEIRTGGNTCFAKFSPGNPPEKEADLLMEAQRMQWAEEFINVPVVLSCEQFEEGQLMLTAALHGHSAVSELGKGNPERSAYALGHGLRQLHDLLPVDSCPFSWDLTSRVSGLPRDQQSELLSDAPSVDPVVCHGDACLPNTLLDAKGDFLGHVDMGNLGVADRWADLAIAAWSTEWNYGAGYEELVYAGYGIDPDQKKIEFYRRVRDAT